MTAQAFDWVKYLSPILSELDQKPQFGAPLPFPKSEFEKGLREIFKDPSLTFKLEEKGWQEPSECLQGVGSPFSLAAFNMAPLKTHLYWLFSHESLMTLLSALLNQDKSALRQESSIVEGFYTFFLLEAMSRFERLKYVQPLEPRLDEKHSQFALEEYSLKEPCFVLDIALTVKGSHLVGKILIPNSFRNEWKHYFATQYESMGEMTFIERESKNIPLEISLNIGQTELILSEWEQVKTGDFIVLDHCSYDPDEKKGRIILMFKERPLFRAKIHEEGGIKLLEYPFYEEVKTMARDLDDDFDDDDDDDFFSDLDDDDDEEVEDADEESEEEIDEIEKEIEEEQLSSESDQPTKGEPTPITAKDIPVQITVEVGRIQLSAYELMQLRPGNVMELPVAPEQGVRLFLNGKHIGKGELIRMGDVLGVRILKM